VNYINPDDPQELEKFLREWKSCYTKRNPLEPPTIASMRTLYQYATDGSIPGEFITAVLCGDLYAAFNTAPKEDLPLINSLVQYITIRLPIESWGNSDKYGNWINKMKKSKMFRPTKHY